MRRSRVPVLVVLATLFSCSNFQEEEVSVSFGVNSTELTFLSSGAICSVTVSSGMKWDIPSMPHWINLQSIRLSGYSPYEWVADFSATANDEYNREGRIVIKAGMETAEIFVSQEGKNGAYVPVGSITISPKELTMTEGDTEMLVATVLPDDASDKTVVWSSSNPGIASVNKGEVTALKEGVSTIIAKAGDISATCRVSISKRVIPVETIKLNKVELELIEGESETLVATILPEDATDKSVIWSSSDDGIASVEGGVVLAIKAGSASITAKSGERSATCLVKVKTDSLNEPIQFADSRVKEILVSAFDTNDDGELTYGEAAKVNSIDGVFSTAKAISSFDEFQYFTSVQVIPSRCFLNSLIESIVLPTSIRRIDDGAFSGCAKLSNVVLNDNLTSISGGAFSNCIGLKIINLPSSLESLGVNSFSGCSSLEAIRIPDGIKSIPTLAFSGCESLSAITIPSNLESIETEAFSDCKRLSSFEFPNTLKSIRSYAFKGTGLTSVIIPDSVENLDMGVFSGCKQLTQISLPKNLTEIPVCFLERCNSLSSIDIPSNVMTISRYAFQHTGLNSVIIPANVVRIDYGAFYQCDKMKSVTVLAESVPKGDSDMFGGVPLFSPMNYPIYVPSASVDAYKEAQYWKVYADRIFPISNNGQ